MAGLEAGVGLVGSLDDYDIPGPQSQPLSNENHTALKSVAPKDESPETSFEDLRLKAGKKYQQGPKVIIHTKSEEDKPDDGYRWRMYGRKAVKGSEFWRNYYRCTTPDCGVRRMTERSVTDPETVVTTYVGIHTHAVPEEYSAVNHHYTGGALSSGFADIQAPIQGFAASGSGSGFDPTPTSGGTGLLEDMLPSHLLRNDM